MNQCNKLHLLYRLTSERVYQLNSIGEQPFEVTSRNSHLVRITYLYGHSVL